MQNMTYNLIIQSWIERRREMKQTENMSGYMGTKEASALWGVSQNTISRWCREKKIPAEQDDKGSPWRIPVDAIPPHK